jgi:hypothetical protein
LSNLSYIGRKVVLGTFPCVLLIKSWDIGFTRGTLGCIGTVVSNTEATDCGASLQAILAGKEIGPTARASFDIPFWGRANGRLSDRLRGTDYIQMRADGGSGMDIRASVETDDGRRMALSADGVALPHGAEPIVDLFELRPLVLWFQ